MRYEDFIRSSNSFVWVDFIAPDIYIIFRSIHLGIMYLHGRSLSFHGSLDDVLLMTDSIDKTRRGGRLVVSDTPTDSTDTGVKFTAKLAWCFDPHNYESASRSDVFKACSLLYECLNFDKTKSKIPWVTSPDESWDEKLRIFLGDMASIHIDHLPPSMFLDHPFLFQDEVENMMYSRKANCEILFTPGYSDDIIVPLLDDEAFNSDGYMNGWKALLRSNEKEETNRRILSCLFGRYNNEYSAYLVSCKKSGEANVMSKIDYLTSRESNRLFRDFAKVPYDIQRHTNRRGFRGPLSARTISARVEKALCGATLRLHSIFIAKFGEAVFDSLNKRVSPDDDLKDLRIHQCRLLKSSNLC